MALELVPVGLVKYRWAVVEVAALELALPAPEPAWAPRAWRQARR